jgi:hypothetical protein
LPMGGELKMVPLPSGDEVAGDKAGSFCGAEAEASVLSRLMIPAGERPPVILRTRSRISGAERPSLDRRGAALASFSQCPSSAPSPPCPPFSPVVSSTLPATPTAAMGERAARCEAGEGEERGEGVAEGVRTGESERVESRSLSQSLRKREFWWSRRRCRSRSSSSPYSQPASSSRLASCSRYSCMETKGVCGRSVREFMSGTHISFVFGYL